MLRLAKKFQRPAMAVIFTAPITLCLQRNRARARAVADSVIVAQAAQLGKPKDLLAEGFDQVALCDADGRLSALE